MYDYFFFIQHDGKFVLSMTGTDLTSDQIERMSAVEGCAYLVMPAGVVNGQADERAIEAALNRRQAAR